MSETAKKAESIIHRWWREDLGGHSAFDSGAARKARAELRRAAHPSDVLMLQATHTLLDDLVKAGAMSRSAAVHHPERLALVAAVMAGLDEGSNAPLAQRFGRKVNDVPLLSHLRFQRILGADDDWELATRLRRALPIAGRKANVGRLGTDLLHWGESVRNRWCFDYFGAQPPGEDDAAQEHDAEPTPGAEDKDN